MPVNIRFIRKRIFLAKRRNVCNCVRISIHIFTVQNLQFVFVNVIPIGLLVLCGASSTKSYSPLSFAMTVSFSLCVRPSVRTSKQVSNVNIS
jgi:hypothetical protein